MPRDLSTGSSLGHFQGIEALLSRASELEADELSELLYKLGTTTREGSDKLAGDADRWQAMISTWGETRKRQAWTWVGQVLDERMTMEKHDPRRLGRPTVGSSDVAVIMGVSPWRDSSRIHTWAELAGLIPYRQGEATSAMRIGIHHEGFVLDLYENETGNRVFRNSGPEAIQYRAAYPWMHSTPDGSAVTPEDQAYATEEWGPDGWTLANIRDPINAEAKVVVRGGVWYPEPPRYYIMQCMWHNICTARSLCHLPALFLGPYEHRIFSVGRDIELERRLVGSVWAWYERHVIGGEPPEPDDTVVAAQTLAKLHRKLTEDKAMPATHEDIVMVQRIREIRERVAELESERKRLTNELRSKTVQAEAKTLRHPQTDSKLAGWTSKGAFIVTKRG